MKSFEHEILELMKKRNMLSDDSLRDYIVREKYNDLRKKGLTGKEARINLAEEFCTGEENISRILYRKK